MKSRNTHAEDLLVSTPLIAEPVVAGAVIVLVALLLCCGILLLRLWIRARRESRRAASE